MNPMISGIMKDFIEAHEFSAASDSEQFELLAAHSLFSAGTSEEFELEECMAGNDTVGIDAVLIVANGVQTLDAEVAQKISDEGRSLDVTFYFSQAKTSAKFDASQILNFGHSVVDFFRQSATVVESPFITNLRQVKDVFYSKSALFKNRLPLLKLSFVTLGSVVADINIEAARSTVKGQLQDLGLFADVHFELVGAKELHGHFMNASLSVEATVDFQKRTNLPKIAGVSQAFIGALPFREFRKLISTEDDALRKGVFYDNVRDFQGRNPVNVEMLSTLNSDDAALFPVLNNGVTIVAQSVTPVADEMTIRDYQIVNGCQTSHILYSVRNTIAPETLIPLRLIVTEDSVVASKITKATNSQTPVLETELVALTDFQKQLEAHYKGYQDKQRLYYERRSNQYGGEGVEQTRVITTAIQIRAFAAMFLEEPHVASRYYKELNRRVPTKIFNPEHALDAYYTSAYAWYRLDVAFRLRKISSGTRPARFTLLPLFKILATGEEKQPQLNSKKMSAYCSKINEALASEATCTSLFQVAATAVLEAGDGVLTRDKAKREKLFKDAVTRLSAMA